MNPIKKILGNDPSRDREYSKYLGRNVSLPKNKYEKEHQCSNCKLVKNDVKRRQVRNITGKNKQGLYTHGPLFLSKEKYCDECYELIHP